MSGRWAVGLIAAAVLAGLSGCGGDSRRAEFGKTYYIDGAGNWGFGVSEIANALEQAGYPGSVEAYLWTTSFNPAIDQVNRPAARLRAAILSAKIRKYLHTYPDNDVNIIALSAGTGVGMWAVEGLPSGVRIKNMVLLGSSLSSNYDVSKAMEHIAGKVYVYYSPYDQVLDGPVRVLGTIDGAFGVEAAGLVGLQAAKAYRGRIINIPWQPKYAAYGWAGDHTGSTSEPFVRQFIAPQIVQADRHPRSATTQASARQLATATH